LDELKNIPQRNLRSLINKLETENLDAALIAWESNVFYLTGLPKPSGSYLLILRGENPKLFVPALDYWRVSDSVKGFEVVPYASYQLPAVEVKVLTKKLYEYVVDELTSRNIKSLGIDLSYTTSLGSKVESRAKEKGIEVKDVSDLVTDMRSIKSDEEVSLMRRALEITEEALWRGLEVLKPGIRECEVAAEIEYVIKSKGADGLAFDTIVASGPNAAYPHAIPGTKEVREGETVVIDVGAKYCGYCADMTRTVIVGSPPPEVKKVIEAVNEAVLNAIDKVADGVKAEEIDDAARSTLGKYGLDKYFIHSTGHGVGIEVHEKPRLGKGSKEVVKEGMVITIEPGVYLHKHYGVRIENMILVRKNHGEILNRKPNIV